MYMCIYMYMYICVYPSIVLYILYTMYVICMHLLSGTSIAYVHGLSTTCNMGNEVKYKVMPYSHALALHPVSDPWQSLCFSSC